MHTEFDAAVLGRMRMSAIREVLKKNPMIHALGKEVRTSARRVGEGVRHRQWKRQRLAAIQAYMRATNERKLHIGCGPMILEGWLNTDMTPLRERGVIYLDITEPLPLPDGSFDYVYSEHLIEHVSLPAGIDHMKECNRILKRGGIMRIATPDLQFLLDYFAGRPLTPVQQGFLDEIIHEFHPGLGLRSPAILLNEFVREWGHQFIYDRDVLRQAMELAGFGEVISCNVKESRHPPLDGLERHGTAISDAYNVLQTMVLEGTKR
jgi:predicted SAM-dependent methyltransferase